MLPYKFIIVAAHPDDETIGASTVLPQAVAIVHVTDGAPRNMLDAARCGFSCRERYAAERRKELHQAIALTGSIADKICLGIPDQEAAYNIEKIAEQLRAVIERIRPDAVLTHPYEGGHPDHDACAMAVRLACNDHIPVWEFASYHNRNGSICTNEFLPGGDPGEKVELRGLQKLQKRRMIDCFRTQAETLRYFPLGCERLRPAPDYDFTIPPHPGTLYYEQFDWGMTGERFRQLAVEALAVC